ncbi:hypothetical protein MRX96_057744 [Rhipicephalus microplus]
MYQADAADAEVAAVVAASKTSQRGHAGGLPQWRTFFGIFPLRIPGPWEEAVGAGGAAGSARRLFWAAVKHGVDTITPLL